MSAVLKRCIEANANVNARESSRGQTALMWAAAENNAAAINVARRGWRRRQRPDQRRRGGCDRAPGRRPVCSPPQRAPRRRRPLEDRRSRPCCLRCSSGSSMQSARCSKAGASVNDALPDGTSALVLATQNGHWELGAFLIDQGADVNADKQGWTALHQIVRLRRTNIGFLPPPIGKGNISSSRSREEADRQRRQRERRDDQRLPRRLSQPDEPGRRDAVSARVQERSTPS